MKTRHKPRLQNGYDFNSTVNHEVAPRLHLPRMVAAAALLQHLWLQKAIFFASDCDRSTGDSRLEFVFGCNFVSLLLC